MVIFGSAAGLAASSPSLCARTVGSATQMAAPMEVRADQGLAVVADRIAGLLIYDVSITSEPMQIGSVLLPHSRHVFSLNGYAYLVAATPGPGSTTRSKLLIFDLHSPTTPVEVGSLDLGSTPGIPYSGIDDIDVADDIVYLIAGYGAEWRGLRMVDVSDPESPTILATHAVSGTPTGVAVRGTTLYLADGGLTIFDVSDPAAPSELGSFPVPLGARGLAVSDGVVYLPTYDGLRVVDVSLPENPIEIGSFEPPSDWTMESVHVSEGTALVTYTKYLLQSMAQLLDVTDPTAPVLAYDDLEAGLNPATVSLDGDTAFVGRVGGTMRIIDISNPTQPVTVGAIEPFPIALVRCAQRHAYTVGYSSDELNIAQIPDVGHPFDVGSYQAPGVIHDVFLEDDIAYIAAGETGLAIVDVSISSAPIEVGLLATSISAHEIAVSGRFAFVSSGYAMATIDIADPTAPSEFGVFESLPDFEMGPIAASGDTVVVAALNWPGPGPTRNELWIIDVSQPDHPALVSMTDLPLWGVTDIALEGDLAFVTVDWRGLLVFDISHRESPSLVGVYEQDLLDSYTGVELLDGRAFVTSRSRAFQNLDVSDPRHPVHKGASFEDFDGSSVSLSDGRACFLLEHSQLVILDVESLDSCAAPRSPTGRRITSAAHATP